MNTSEHSPDRRPQPFVSREFVTPRVVMSACIELEACRHNGHRIADSFIRRLLPHIHLEPICPEVEIGLGVPRDPVRLVGDGDQARLIQPSTERDLSESMHRFADRFLDTLGPVDGIILKSGSPSCGIKGVRVYASEDRGAAVLRTRPGLFAGHVLDRYSDLALESEGRLRNYPIRHNFLTQLYAYADLRQLAEARRPSELADFQRRHKHLLMTYDQKKMRILGRIAANAGARDWEESFCEYASVFRQALQKMPGHGSYINSLTHMYGHFKTRLSTAESDDFLYLLDQYAEHRLPLHALLAVVRSWCSRFHYEYFADQSLLEPYPHELIQMRDSGKGIDF